MLLVLLNYVVLRALWKIAVHLISTHVNKKKSLTHIISYSYIGRCMLLFSYFQ